MSNIDIVPVLDWLERKKKESKTFPSGRSTKTDPDLVELLQKEIRRSASLEAFFKDLEKLRKKEEKKSGLFDKLTTTQLTIIMVVTVPVYLVMLMRLLT